MLGVSQLENIAISDFKNVFLPFFKRQHPHLVYILYRGGFNTRNGHKIHLEFNNNLGITKCCPMWIFQHKKTASDRLEKHIVVFHIKCRSI